LTLDISNNEFEYLNAQECSALTSLNVSNNKLTQLLLPTESVLTSLKENNNKFTLATLPQIDGLTEFVYAPQTEYTIPTKGPGVNLSSQYLKGTTTYVWKKVDGTLLVAGTDYTEKEGKFSFTRDDIGKVYCEMTNSELPDFSGENVYKTTVMETAGMPQHVVATFVTANSDEDAVLTMTSLTEGNAVFVDWTGNFDLEQYDLGTTYTAYDVTTTAGAEVTVYSYDEVDNISVFTLRNATLKSMDASAMKQLVCFGVTNGGLSDADIKYPESPNLGELLMQGNKISAFDFTKYKNLWYVNLAENAYKEFTLPDNMPIQQLFIGGNEMTKMDLGKNSTLWSLFAEENNLESVDFTGVPNISQMTLANNKLSTIDLSPIKNLNALSLVGNRFTFVTLPRLSEINPNNASPVYYYGNQENLNVTPTEDGVIDLSEQAYVGETATTYTWILGTPNYDDDGELTNEVLISVAEATADDTESDETDDDSSESTDEAEEVIPDYEEVGGVSTFFFTFDNLVCMMNNAEFENLTLMTNPVKVSGVETVGTDVLDSAYVKVEGHNVVVVAPAGLNIRIYDTAGRSVAGRTAVEGENLFSGLGSGIYVVTLGNKAAKVLVK
jgi:Leucine-rich repeat (LRR) protein